MIEHVIEHVDDPYEVEKWSNYLDAYVNEDNVNEELLTEAPGLPVFLPRYFFVVVVVVSLHNSSIQVNL